jgi:hypothetical protein
VILKKSCLVYVVEMARKSYAYNECLTHGKQYFHLVSFVWITNTDTDTAVFNVFCYTDTEYRTDFSFFTYKTSTCSTSIDSWAWPRPRPRKLRPRPRSLDLGLGLEPLASLTSLAKPINLTLKLNQHFYISFIAYKSISHCYL